METASSWLVPIAISWELNATVVFFHWIPFETSTESVLYSGISLWRRRMKNYSWYGEKMEKFFRKWCTAKNFVTFLVEVFPWAPSFSTDGKGRRSNYADVSQVQQVIGIWICRGKRDQESPCTKESAELQEGSKRRSIRLYKFTLTLYKGSNDQPDLVEKKLYTIHVHFYTDKKNSHFQHPRY